MTTPYDCAVLSEDVYSREHNNLARTQGWERLDAQNWTEGFAAGTYIKNDEVVVAFRGTDDFVDIFSDARMVPNVTQGQVDSVTSTVFKEYGIADKVEAQIAGQVLASVLTSRPLQKLISSSGNQAPPTQTRQALKYLDQVLPSPTVVTGHSLGGALAKVMGLRAEISCVAFNSPFMGDLRSVRPFTTHLVRSINTRGDPLSLATQAVGNLPHGSVEWVDILAPAAHPPEMPKMASYSLPFSCPAPPRLGIRSGPFVLAELSSDLCNVTREFLEPIGQVATAPARRIQWALEKYPDYVLALGQYLEKVAIHYHSMTNLRKALAALPGFHGKILF